MSGKPLPPIDPASAAYWARCGEGELTVQRCKACGHRQHYPRVVCTACGADTLELEPVSGRGVLRSYTVIRRAVSSAFDDDVPYVVALIALVEGPCMMANVINCEAEAVHIGQAVEVVFEARGELQIPQFQPVA